MKTLKQKFRKCLLKSCKKKFEPRSNSQLVCDYECYVKFTAENTAKANYEANKKWKERQKEGYEKLKTHSDWSGELQIEINTIARLIDKGAPCISSLRNGNEQMQGGHRFSCGAFPQLRFNLFNIHGQTASENMYNSGNPDGYDFGMRCMYGDQYCADVHYLKKQYPTLKLTIPELIQAKSKAKKIVAELKKLDLVYPPKVRIELRREYNDRLKIYN